MIVLRNIAGLLVQILPCAVLCFLPFQGMLTVPLKRAVGRVGIPFLILGAVFVVLGSVPLSEELAFYRIPVLNVLFGVMVVVLAATFFPLVHASARKKLFVILLAALFGCFILLVNQIPLGMLDVGEGSDGYLYSVTYLVVTTVASAVGLVFMVPAMRLVGRLLRGAVGDETWGLMCFFPAGCLAVACLTYWMPDNLELSTDMVSRVLSVGITLLALLAGVWSLFLLNRADRDAGQRTALELKLRGYKLQAESAERVQRVRHDMSHHLQALDVLMREGDVAGARAYLTQVTDAFAEHRPLHLCANHLVNAILAEYVHRAEREGVGMDCDVSIPSQLALSDVDACRLLTNMLDNALEGCRAARTSHGVEDGETLPGGQTVEFQMCQEGAFLYLSCENPCDTARLRPYDEDFETSKRAEGHGFGLSIMKEVASTYNGAFSCGVENGRFKVFVNLCLGEGAERACTE